MIIWNGLGILVLLAGIVGLVLGMLISTAMGLGTAGIGIGCIIAALANWGLCKMMYNKPPRILIDSATGQPVILKAKHSLFYIPAKAWTWLFAILAVPGFVVGFIGDAEDKKQQAMSGYQEFKAADTLINSKSSGINHGNTTQATASAADFSSALKLMVETVFSGGSKKNLMTGGDFLTYCYDGKDTIVFLCHVPSLRSFKTDETKNSLNGLAWSIATDAAKKIDPEGKKQLAVGLRGFASYGSLMKGKIGDENPASTAVSPNNSDIISAFAPVAAAPTETNAANPSPLQKVEH
jgi:hypothetical protein